MTYLIACTLSLMSAVEDTGWISSQGGQWKADDDGYVVEIDLSSSWITDMDLRRIAGHRRLQKLDLSHTRVTNAGLEHLAVLPDVRELNLYYAAYVSDGGVAHLTNWRRLEHLDLQGTQITSRSLESISRLTELRSLDISFTAINDDGFEHLGSLRKLKKLAMGGNRLNGSCISFLPLLPALVDLDLSGIQQADSGLWGLPLSESNLRQIGTLKQLKILRLHGANVNDRGADSPSAPDAVRTELRDLSALKGLTNLEVLDLSCTPVSSESLMSLASLTCLQELRLGLAPNIDADGLGALSGLKSVKVVLGSAGAVASETRASP
jgi:internalin A